MMGGNDFLLGTREGQVLSITVDTEGPGLLFLGPPAKSYLVSQPSAFSLAFKLFFFHLRVPN
jgi:hypothetical protein